MNKAKTKFIAIVSSVAVVLLALMIVLQVVMYANESTMDTWLGHGKRVDVKADESMTGDYIDFKYSDLTSAAENAQDVTQQVAEEGMVLLKNENNALPLAKNTKVTLLDYWGWHNNMAGGEDPATTRGAVSLYRGIWEDEDFDVNTANLKDATAKALDDTDIPTKDSATLTNNPTYGQSSAALDAALGTTKDTYNTAIVTIKRNSGEGNDQKKYITTEGENLRTGLTLTRAEMEIIDYANKNFDKVILLINSVNTMELGFLDENDPNMKDGIYTDPYGTGVTMDCSKIAAAVWVGGCGSQAGYAIANILKGEVNPSGHLSDIYARVLRDDPTYNNMSSENGEGADAVVHEYSNSTALNSYAAATYFSEYEEGIYIGYRYHETAAAEAAKGNYEGYDYDEAVVYPFGYGLSYTTFTQEYEGAYTYDDETETFTFKVKVTNTGSVAGKGVAQIYVNVPWEKGQVEKAHVVLGGFAKTGVLDPNGDSEVVTIEIKKDYFSSYDYKSEKAYLLDAGDYKFYLASDELGSHSWTEIDKMDASEQAKVLQTYNQANRVVYNEQYGKRVTDDVVATNVMDDELNSKFKSYKEGSTGDGYIHDFSREDFKKSFPTAPTGQDFVLSGDYHLQYVAKYNVWQDTDNNVDEDGNPIDQSTVPETNVDETNYTLADMRGVDIDDEKWDDYINQFTVDSMENMFGNGGWGQPGDEDNGVPKTLDADSPYGYYAFQAGIRSGGGQNTWYCSAPMVAATFNTTLAKEVGRAFGEEAKALGINGLYGFGMNQHRSAFGGRNYEYYSEDPVLCGKIGAAEAEGANEKGLITYMKHFVLNDQEAYRQANGYCAWVNEQAFREVYLRAWEIYMKEATTTMNYYAVNKETGSYEMAEKEISAATAIMTCYNRIGTTFGGASVCINGILRREFGFTGTVLTDAGGQKSTYMTTDLALRRGQNLCLTDNGSTPNASLYDTESPTAVYWLKHSTKYLLFNIANSNTMQGLAPGDTFYYEISPWKVGLIVGWVVVGIYAAAAVVLDVLVAKDVIHLKEKEKKQRTEDEY